jgi:hypothetical protein
MYFFNHIVVIDVLIARVQLWRPIQSRTLSYNFSTVDLYNEAVNGGGCLFGVGRNFTE